MINYKKGKISKGLEIDSSMFKLHPGFLAGAIIVGGIITALYTIFW
jgi:solute:Na+ symporter, SSS family